MATDPAHGARYSVSPLPFGIPVLDEFLGYESLFHEPPKKQACQPPAHWVSQQTQPTSIAIVGQDGTGKSIFALHLASTYLAIHEHHRFVSGDRRHVDPHVFYLSSDLSFGSACRAWNEFGLGSPWLRFLPFVPPEDAIFRQKEKDRILEGATPFTISLAHCALHCDAGSKLPPELSMHASPDPFDGKQPPIAHEADLHTESIIEFLHRAGIAREKRGRHAEVGFVDLNRYTTGDDWLFAVRLVAGLARKHSTASPNLLIVDSVEGFETLIGEKNTFGEGMSRRARIAQLIRAAKSNWHIVLLVEEPEPGKRHPEEYVADTVLRLRRRSQGEKVRRLLEIEKCRGRSFASGEHPFEIRSGLGSSTGDWENPDDPYAIAHPQLIDKGKFRAQPCSYVQVFASLNHLSRKFASSVALFDQQSADARMQPEGETPKAVVSFGIPYLDDLLTQAGPADQAGTNTGKREIGCLCGLPAGTITSLIGDGGTRKKALAEQFLLQQFNDLPEIWQVALDVARAWITAGFQTGMSFIDFIRNLDKKNCPAGMHLAGPDGHAGRFEILKLLQERLKASIPNKDELPVSHRSLDEIAQPKVRPYFLASNELQDSDGPFRARWDEKSFLQENAAASGEEHAIVLAMALLRLSGGLLTPVVLVTTKDVNAHELVAQLMASHWPKVWAAVEPKSPGPQAANGHQLRLKQMQDLLRWHFVRVIERFVVVRRIDNIDLTAPQLWQIIESCVQHGLKLLGRKMAERRELKPMQGAGAVRVVVSDLRTIRDVYPDVAADPLFLSVLVFRLRRLGITALLVDTDHARPDMPPQPSTLALRSMVSQQILTWKVPFFGEERIAIAVSPPMNGNDFGVIRELRHMVPKKSAAPSQPLRRLDVDPHFELYAGVESGKPEQVPLRISLWRETPAFGEYINRENRLMSYLFPHAPGTCAVMEALPTKDYNALRDYTHLPARTRLSYTHVLVVDGHWALTRDAALRWQGEYLLTCLKGADGNSTYEDVYQLFQPLGTRASGQPDIERRYDAFKQSLNDPVQKPELYYYRSRILQQRKVDRVPFTWDFGFMICDQSQWTRWNDLSLGMKGRDGQDMTVGEVWASLHRLEVNEGMPRDVIHVVPGSTHLDARVVSWREFLGACHCIAREEAKHTDCPVPQLDLVSLTIGSLLSMTLEIWLSEVVQDAVRMANFAANVRSKVPQIDASQTSVLNAVSAWSDRVRTEIGALSTEMFHGFDEPPTRSGADMVQFLEGDPDPALDLRFHAASERKTLAGTTWPPAPAAPPGENPAAWQAEWRTACLQATIGSGYSLQLYKAWLLMLEVFDFVHFQGSASHDAPVMDYWPQDKAIAVRHWYKTACWYFDKPEHEGIDAAQPRKIESGRLTKNHENEATSTTGHRPHHGEGLSAAMADRREKVPVRMPGHFSMRGDWFLGVARSSRSDRLANMALDMLTSRRANRTRLEMGLGLPTRDLLHGEALSHIRTGLALVGREGRRLVVPYGKLLKLGGSYAVPENHVGHNAGIQDRQVPEVNLRASSFYWLFRSGFQHYYRHEPLLTTWVQRLVAWTASQQLRDDRAKPRTLGDFRAYDSCHAGDVSDPKLHCAFVDFSTRLNYLCAELQQEPARMDK